MSAKVGRPTKYDPAYCEKVVELGRKGCGLAEIAYELDVTRQTLQNWQVEHPQFLGAITHARELSEGWWASQGRAGIWSREFNANAYRLQVMNRFPSEWRDKREIEHGGELPVLVVKREDS